MRLNSRLLGAAAAITFAGAAAATNLVANGSFELGTFVNDGFGTMTFSAGPTTITDWTAVGNRTSWIGNPNPWLLSAEDGNMFLDLTGYHTGAPFGGVTQTIATAPGTQYELTYQLGTYTRRWGGPPVSILATAPGASGTCLSSAITTQSTWTSCSLTFTAIATTSAITLAGSAGVQYIGLDNVAVAPTSSATPEPASLGCVALGSAGLVLLRRARRRTNWRDR